MHVVIPMERDLRATRRFTRFSWRSRLHCRQRIERVARVELDLAVSPLAPVGRGTLWESCGYYDEPPRLDVQTETEGCARIPGVWIRQTSEMSASSWQRSLPPQKTRGF
jgi:hypothetical protein